MSSLPSRDSETPVRPAIAALRVIALTASAWQVPPVSARAVARRAPYGYVPRRVIRRLRAIAAVGPPGQWVVAHSW